MKLTDKVIYLYQKKSKEFIKKEIKSNIIKENKIYDIKKSINILNKILKEDLINNKLFKTKIYFLLSKNISPAELFTFEYVFNNILNINYNIIYEENLLKENNEIILWNDQLSFTSKIFSIHDKVLIKKTLKSKDYILIGNSLKWEEYKNELEKITKNRILEYENSQTILFERV